MLQNFIYCEPEIVPDCFAYYIVQCCTKRPLFYDATSSFQTLEMEELELAKCFSDVEPQELVRSCETIDGLDCFIKLLSESVDEQLREFSLQMQEAAERIDDFWT